VGGNIQIIGRATDGAGNFAEDTITIFLNNVQALRVQLVVCRRRAGLDREGPAGRCHRHPEFGYREDRVPRVTGVQRDQPDDTAQRLVRLHGAVRRFGGVRRHADRRSLQRDVQRRRLCGRLAGRRGFSTVVTVVIQSVATDVQVPVVAHRVGERVEVDDTIHVRAQDPSAISWMGFRVDTSGVLMKFDTVFVGAGNLTDVTRHFTLGLQGLQPLPHTIVVRGYACDGAVARNCSFTNSTTLIPSRQWGGSAPASLARPAPMVLIDTVIASPA
jgi:hypothetical protein